MKSRMVEYQLHKVEDEERNVRPARRAVQGNKKQEAPMSAQDDCLHLEEGVYGIDRESTRMNSVWPGHGVREDESEEDPDAQIHLRKDNGIRQCF